MSLYVDVHALHTVPPSNINRDDTGAPKTATFGGVVRHRVSSQAWKRAIRKDFKNYLAPDQLGFRTKRVVEKAVKAIEEIDASWETERAADAVVAVLNAAGIKPEKPKKKEGDEQEPLPQASYLLFLSAHQIQRLAQHVVDTDGQKPSKRVDAVVQVAHALGVAAAEPEFDYYTAVDDVVEDADESGAGMIGTGQMMSSTLYRYATVNMDQLVKNLDSSEAAVEAAGSFIQSFITSMPTGKQNSYANQTLPEAVVVSVRDDRPISLVNAFEDELDAESGKSRRQQAAARLVKEAQSIQETYSAPAKHTWVLALKDLRETLAPLGTAVNRDELLAQLKQALVAEES